MHETLRTLRPFIAAKVPHLLVDARVPASATVGR